MNYESFEISLPEHAAHAVRELAANDYRHPETFLQIVIYLGMQSLQFEREMNVRKKLKDVSPDNKGERQYYTDDEIVEFFKPEIK
jgi:hypothetical protein